jgi:hypothetical protein
MVDSPANFDILDNITQNSPVHTLNAYALIGIGRLPMQKLNA